MTARHSTIHVTRRYGAPPQRVFAAWLDPRAAGRWLFATASRPLARVAIDARVEGSFRFLEREMGKAVEYTGEYVEIRPPRRLVFTLCANGAPVDDTRVTVDVMPSKGGTMVSLTHERVPAEHASRIEGRWTGILYGLGVTLAANLPDRARGALSNSAPTERP